MLAFFADDTAVLHKLSIVFLRVFCSVSIPAIIPVTICFPTSFLNTLEGDLIPNAFLAAFKALLASPCILLNKDPAIAPTPPMIPFTMFDPTLPQLIPLNALTAFVPRLLAALPILPNKLSSPDISFDITVFPKLSQFTLDIVVKIFCPSDRATLPALPPIPLIPETNF